MITQHISDVARIESQFFDSSRTLALFITPNLNTREAEGAALEHMSAQPEATWG